MDILSTDWIIVGQNNSNVGSKLKMKVGEWVNVHTWCLSEGKRRFLIQKNLNYLHYWVWRHYIVVFEIMAIALGLDRPIL